MAKLMKENGLSAEKNRAFKPRTTINNPSDKKSDRVFKIEDFKPKKANEVWASDLTYIPTKKGFCYLVVVEDLFNREIIGWDLSDSMDTGNTKKALNNALKVTNTTLRGTVFTQTRGPNIVLMWLERDLSLLL